MRHSDRGVFGGSTRAVAKTADLFADSQTRIRVTMAGWAKIGLPEQLVKKDGTRVPTGE